jgi:pimeloyl-ACP methyl ester carboxylesterase
MNTTYTTGTVQSKDGTIIGFKQFGKGEGLILLHGGMQASQNFTELATALSDEFIVYVPDRRGRGLSGAYGEQYGIDREREDIQAVLDATSAENIFGLSSGAIVSLETALHTEQIRKSRCMSRRYR